MLEIKRYRLRGEVEAVQWDGTEEMAAELRERWKPRPGHEEEDAVVGDTRQGLLRIEGGLLVHKWVPAGSWLCRTILPTNNGESDFANIGAVDPGDFEAQWEAVDGGVEGQQ